nr:hypothetical protein [Tanacetum cinerariifolium]
VATEPRWYGVDDDGGSSWWRGEGGASINWWRWCNDGAAVDPRRRGNGDDICQMVVIEAWRSGGYGGMEAVHWCAPAVAAESLAEDGRRRRKAWPEKGRRRKY